MIKKSFRDFIKMNESRSYDELNEKTIENIGMDEFKSTTFYADFNYAISEMPKDNYKSFAIERRNGYCTDPEEISEEINSGLRSVKFTFDHLKKNKDLIFKNIEVYSNISGQVDIILWRLDNNYHVGGWDKEFLLNGDECYIKYRYGYHNTIYGRILIKQNWGSLDKFYEDIKMNMVYNFIKSCWVIHDPLGNVKSEVEKEGGLVVDFGNSIIRVYVEDLYWIASPFLRKKEYENFETFRNEFITWIKDSLGTEVEIISDMSERYIEIDFLRIED